MSEQNDDEVIKDGFEVVGVNPIPKKERNMTS